MRPNGDDEALASDSVSLASVRVKVTRGQDEIVGFTLTAHEGPSIHVPTKDWTQIKVWRNPAGPPGECTLMGLRQIAVDQAARIVFAEGVYLDTNSWPTAKDTSFVLRY